MEIFDDNFPTKDLFVFLKYNILPTNENVALSETDEKLFTEFQAKIQLLKEQFKNNDEKAKATASSMFTMFGFNRHYCSMTGQPIIGKYFKIGNKIVSKEAYEAHKIIQEIENKNEKQGGN